MGYLSKSGRILENALVIGNLKNMIVALSDSALAFSGLPLPITTVVSEAISIYDKVKEAALMDKAIKFAEDFSTIPINDREKLINDINDDPIYGQGFGEFLLNSFDRFDFNIKAKYLARACKYYHLNYVNREDFIRLKTIIENISMPDVDKWILIKDDLSHERTSFGAFFDIPKDESDPAYNTFLNLGILYREYDFESLITSKEVFSTNIARSVMKTKLTDLGQKVYFIIKDLTPHSNIIYGWKG